MERQFTATAYIIENKKVLLLFHKKLNKWLPPGGHLDNNELPPEGAIREVFEETGLNIDIIPEENLWIERLNASSFPRPYMCLLEEIPEYNGYPAHQHVDFIYLAKLKPDGHNPSPQEMHNIKWFSLHEIEELVSDKEIFDETKQTLRKILVES